MALSVLKELVNVGSRGFDLSFCQHNDMLLKHLGVEISLLGFSHYRKDCCVFMKGYITSSTASKQGLSERVYGGKAKYRSHVRQLI